MLGGWIAEYWQSGQSWNDRKRMVETENESWSSGRFFPGRTPLKLLQEFQNIMEKENAQPEVVDVQRYWLVTRQWIFLQNSSFVAAYAIRLQKDIGHSSNLNLKRNGTVRLPTNQTVRGTESLKWWIYLSKAGIMYPEERMWDLKDLSKANEAEGHRNITTRNQRLQCHHFASWFPSISSVSTDT